MQAQERILRERFAHHVCETCGAEHQPDDMLVLAQRGSRWLVLLTCRCCKRRGIFVASFPQPSPRNESLDSTDPFERRPSVSHLPSALSQPWPVPPTAPRHDDPLSPAATPHPSFPVIDAPVTTDDVDSMKRFLEEFDGDFRTLFGPSEGRRHG